MLLAAESSRAITDELIWVFCIENSAENPIMVTSKANSASTSENPR
jgi:hypothetical protein